jgi:rhodanese-related sulfurtransferase
VVKASEPDVSVHSPLQLDEEFIYHTGEVTLEAIARQLIKYTERIGALVNLVSVADTAAMLADGSEYAFIDVREIVPFGAGHPLLAANVPLSRLELSVGALIPRFDTRIVLTDGGGGHSELAAARLGQMGYSAIAAMEGGAPAWAEAGEALFPEIEVLAKGFGGFAKRHGKPNYMSPVDLDRALKSGEDWVVLDSRPRAEYQLGNIPGSIDAPGADLVHCFDDLVPNPETKVLVNCMSATRGTLGGLSLMAAGVPNEIHVLHHGTRGWLLDGLALEKNADRFAAPPSDKARASAVARANRIAKSADIARIDATTLAQWRGDESRTTYIFDVRTPEEYASGHVQGARCAPAGSLPMNPENYFATKNARIVVTDDDTVRATINALWLAQMGLGEVAMLTEALDSATLDTGPELAPNVGVADGSCPEVNARDLEAMRKSRRVRVIDVGHSDAYESSHVPSAEWCSRVALGALLEEELQKEKPKDGAIVLTSEDGAVAKLAAGDLGPIAGVSVLAGGNTAWRKADMPMSSGAEKLSSPRDDHWLAASERPGDPHQNVVDYLDWEVTLPDDIERGGRAPYRNLLWN